MMTVVVVVESSKSPKKPLTARRCITAACLALMLFLCTDSPAYCQNGTPVVQGFIKLASSRANIFNQATQFMDFEEMARRAMGESRWAKMSADKRRDFVATFKRVMEDRYYPRWHKLFARGSMEYLAESSQGHDLLVKTNLTVGKKSDILVWRLTSAPSPRIVSLAVGKRDLLTKAAARLRRSADEKGTDGMIAWLKKKTKERETAREPFESTN